MIAGLNHLTFAVSDLERSMAFYTGLLGFSVRMHGPSSAYLQAGTLWLALVLEAAERGGPARGYSHAAFSVTASEMPRLVNTLMKAGVRPWQESDRSDSFYFADPDGHKLELHSGDLENRVRSHPFAVQ
jgi:catechol 2,3-dioxygenase-like lactoylglutathione lyase family enzyme